MRSSSAPGGHFPMELSEKIISEAAGKGPTSYSLHLFGEPLLNPQWDKIVKIIRQSNKNNTILLTTNGSVMDESCCKKLLELEVNRIFVSMHSLDAEVYRANTGGGDISVVLSNVKTFAKLARRGGKSKLFIRLFERADSEHIDQEQMDSLRELGISFERRGYHNFAGSKNEWTSFSPHVERWPCFHPWFTLGVAVDGMATICCTDFSLGLNIGNVYEQSIEEIWKSELVSSIRREHTTNRFERWKVCEPCDTWQFHNDIFFEFQYRRFQQ